MVDCVLLFENLFIELLHEVLAVLSILLVVRQQLLVLADGILNVGLVCEYLLLFVLDVLPELLVFSQQLIVFVNERIVLLYILIALVYEMLHLLF